MTVPPGLLEARELRKTYVPGNPSAPAAVESFSHRFAPGKITAILGPSGSGKTTTLGMIAGLTAPDSGELLLDGADLTDLPAERRGFGVVFQNYALFPHLTVRENVEFGLRVRRVPRAERTRRAAETLDLVRIPMLAGRRVHQLSGGEQQRVALARALAFRPRVLLMDEPLSALDAKLRDELRADLARLLENIAVTTIYVTHDQSEAMSLGHELLVMRAGRIEQAGPPAELFRRPANPFVAGFLGSANVFESECFHDGVAGSSGGRPRVRLPFGAFEAPADSPLGHCWVMFRPGDLEAIPPGETGTVENSFPAEVENVFFLGQQIRVHLRVAGPGRLIFDAPNDFAIPREGPLRLRVRPEKLFLRARG